MVPILVNSQLVTGRHPSCHVVQKVSRLILADTLSLDLVLALDVGVIGLSALADAPPLMVALKAVFRMVHLEQFEFLVLPFRPVVL